METAVLAARVLLAAVFVVAGVGKLLDLPGSRRALVDFGVGENLARFAGALLPLAELAVAVTLVLRPSATWGAGGALVLLAVFVAGIVNALRHGQQPDCHCFGRIHSAPAGRSEIVRDLVLAAVAVLILASGPGPALDAWVAARTPAELAAVALGAVAISLLAISLSLWRERGRLAEQARKAGVVPHGLLIGTLAPSFTARGLDGKSFTLEQLCSRGHPVVLIFGEPGCGPCAGIATELPRWERSLAGTLTLGPVGIGAYQRYDAAVARTGESVKQVYERDSELAREVDELIAVLESYRVHATPSAVVVTPEGTVASGTVDGRQAIEALIHLVTARRGAVGLGVRQGFVV